MARKLSKTEWAIIVFATLMCCIPMSVLFGMPEVKPGHFLRFCSVCLIPPIVYSILAISLIKLRRRFEKTSFGVGVTMAGIWSFIYAMVATTMCPLLIKSSFVDTTPLNEMPEIGIGLFLFSLPSSLVPVYLWDGFDTIPNLLPATIILFIVGYTQFFFVGWLCGLWWKFAEKKHTKENVSSFRLSR